MKPCKGKNANVCVAEGCYGESCIKDKLEDIQSYEIEIYSPAGPREPRNGSPFKIVFTGPREQMCSLMDSLNNKGFASLVSEKEGNTCHFCGTYVSKGYETGPNRRKRHWLSDCRPDLIEHDPGESCTWHGLLHADGKPAHDPDCYAYQDNITQAWGTEHKHFYPDGPMG